MTTATEHLHGVVLEVLDGCAPFARDEAAPLGHVRTVSPTELRLTTHDLAAARTLRRVVAVYVAVRVPARRPRELLETSVMRRLLDTIETIRRLRPRGAPFTGLRLAAAGADTPDMRRLAAELAEGAGLPLDDEDGDLLVRVRRGDGAPSGPTWEVLLRITPRPLSARAWRAVDYPGAVNATIAACALDLLDVGAEDSLLDMTCGSGTFLIEQSCDVAPARSVGVDLAPAALDAARANQRAARRKGRIDWIEGDVLTADIAPGFTRIVANPPWGELHGEHATNRALLAALLERAAELAAPGARLGILTHEIARMTAVAAETPSPWALRDEHRFFQKGHHPRLFRFDLR
ncbi:methyltransferase [Brachybacterium huguangmaarense]